MEAVKDYTPEKAEEIESIFRKKGAYSKFKNILEDKANIFLINLNKFKFN